jgi:hypothetical protein
MEEITMSDSVEITDPKLRAIVNRVTRKIELAIEKVGANQQDPAKYPLATDPKSFEQIIASRFRRLSDEKKKNAVAKIMSRINASQTIRQAHYGDLAQVDLTKPESIEAQSKVLPFPDNLKISAEYLKGLTTIHGQVVLPTLTLLGAVPKSSGLVPQTTTDKLEFRIHNITCWDRTSDGFLGTEATDEIASGGLSIDETGDTKTVSDFLVQNFSYDGQQKAYSPPLRFTYFNLNEGTDFPKTYWINPALAEQDNGDFWDYLYNLTNSVKAEISAALAAAVGIAIGSSGGPVGAIIGAVVGAAVGAAFNLFNTIISDEIWEGPTVSCTIPSLSARWSGNTYSPQHIVTYSGYGGLYKMTYSWNLFS